MLVLIALGCAPQSTSPQKGDPLDDEDDPGSQAAKKVALNLPKEFRKRIEVALNHVRKRDLQTNNSFWTVFHGILGNGLDVTLRDPVTGKRHNAIVYVRKGGKIRGMKFLPSPHGLDVRTPRDFVGQGHQDQFVAEMVQWGLPPRTEFIVQGKKYLFADFFKHSKMRASVNDNQELGWTIIIVGQYFGTDITWTNSAGEKISFEDLVRYELDDPISKETACGGTHRLFGLTWCYHLHMQRGGKKTPVWELVARKIDRYKKLAKKFRNADGSFSTNYFEGRGDDRVKDTRIGTTGHILEWLALALSDKELRAPWVQDAVNALVVMILESQLSPIDSGSLYHAVHGLHIYHARVFGKPGQKDKVFPLPPK